MHPIVCSLQAQCPRSSPTLENSEEDDELAVGDVPEAATAASTEATGGRATSSRTRSMVTGHGRTRNVSVAVAARCTRVRLTWMASVRATSPRRYCRGSSGPSHLLCQARGHCKARGPG